MTTAPEIDDAAVRLSTAPEPVGPLRSRQLLAPVRRGWRQLTSMRTALQLLFLLALGAIPGGFLPQNSLNPVRVTEYKVEHPTLAPVLDKLSLFDVFASPWFAAVYLLLFVSLAGCLVPRIRLHARALRKPPPQAPGRLSRLPVSETWETDASVEEVLEAARRALRSRRWRAVRRGTAVSAEKGYLRETGNLVFHVSLVVLLVGIAIGAFYGFKGTVLVKEGTGFANAVLNYDDIQPGRRFAEGNLVPLHFSLDDFHATYGPDGKARTFDAKVRYATHADGALRRYDIRVNHPLQVGVAKVYLLGHGYAPRVVVRDVDGTVAFDQTVPCLPQDTKFVSNCTIKVPDTRGEQLAFEGVFTPTTVQDPATKRVTSAHPAAQAPALTVVGFRGDLGVDAGVPGSVYELDRRRLTPIDGGKPQLLATGQSWQLPGGGSVTFVGTTEWATFQVTQDPGKGVALLASCGIVLGLCLSLFVRRRRLWVRAVPAGGVAGPARTVVEVGGLARTDPETFATEFEELTGRLREKIPPSAPDAGKPDEE
jgi:cytochrome c biogenesis protein